MSTHRSGPTGMQYYCREVGNCRNKHRSPTTVRTIWPVLQDSPSASPQGVPAYWVEATTIQQFQDKPTLSAQREWWWPFLFSFSSNWVQFCYAENCRSVLEGTAYLTTRGMCASSHLLQQVTTIVIICIRLSFNGNSPLTYWSLWCFLTPNTWYTHP